MAYCTYTDVQSEFKNITFSASTQVTDTEVTSFIAQADAEINAKIGLRYETPVTGAVSIILLKQISIWLVAHRIKDILQVKTVTEDVNQGVREGSLRKMAQDLIDQIVQGKVLLSDATLATDHDGIQSYADDNDLEYTFQKDVDQW